MKIKAGDTVRIKDSPYFYEGNWDYKNGEIRTVSHRNKTGCLEVFNNKKTLIAPFYDFELELVSSLHSESRAKKISQSLLKMYNQYPSRLIKSERIIEIVKEDINDNFIFGDTILRALRQLRQDNKLDYDVVGSKKDRDYRFKQIKK